MSRKDLINKINEIIEFLTNGVVKTNNQEFSGHPCFYLIHSKDEFDNKLEEIIANKPKFNSFDLFYYLNYMFKYMLHPYDSHTQAYFIDKKFLPLKIRIISGKPYIVDCNENLNQVKGNEIKKINEVEINTIISELKGIICYSTKEYLKITLEEYLTNINILQALPSIKLLNSIVINTNNGDIKFDLNKLDKYQDKSKKENYNLDIIDDIAIITYNSCKDEEKMKSLIHKLESISNITKYIVDLRGNRGGNSSINKYLINFLNGKEVITLSDERVFSSARMCLMDLKKIGSRIIGTSPGTAINCFGNCVMQKKIDDMGLMVVGSATYWYYDETLELHGIYKENFNNALERYPDLFKPVFFKIDEEIELTLVDYLGTNDSVINYAINELKGNKNRFK